MRYPGSLHNHTQMSNFRLRDCIIKEEELINRAKELGQSVVAITDHETIAAAVKIEKLQKANPDIKIIMGNEIYLVRNGLNETNFVVGQDKYYHFILLAKDRIGFQQICELSTRAWQRSYVSRGMRRVPTYYQDIVDIIGSNPGHIIGSTACFLPGQKVKTKYGEKNIEELTNEDYIMTSKGEWEKINFPTSRDYNGKGNILTFTKEPLDIKCTENHQFLVYENNQLIWKEAKDLKLNDKCLEPVEKTVYSNNNILNILNNIEIINYRKKSVGQNYHNNIFRLKDEIVLTNNIMRFFGLWLADGHISLHEEYNKHEIGLTFNDIEFNVYYNGFVKQALLEFGLKEQDYSIRRKTENHRVDLAINKVEFCLLMKSIFGISHANNKYIPKKILNISKDFNAELFFGYMLGDGYFRYRSSQGGEVVAASISKQLIKDFEQLGISLELSGSITISKARFDKNNVNHQRSYYLTYSNATLGKSLTKKRHISHEKLMDILNKGKIKRPQLIDFININNIQYRIKKVKSNKVININEKVYCLNTNSHNFVLNNIIVHNCLGGMLPTQLLKYKDDPSFDLWGKILNWCQLMANTFGGKDNFYLELQPSASKEQTYVNEKLVEIANLLHLGYIITCDSHYLTEEDKEIHKIYLNAQNGDREIDSFYATTYLMDDEDLRNHLSLSNDEIETSYKYIEKIRDSCTNYSICKPLKIPSLKWKDYSNIQITKEWIDRIPYFQTFLSSDYSGDQILVKAIIQGISQHPDLQNEESYNEINDNLRITWESSNVNKAHWSAYYLNLQKIIDLCWEAGSIVGPGRGSGVGFLLLYCLGITQINPLQEETKCFSWRFLNPERVSVLDVDFDIEGRKRQNVLNKFREFYGQDRVSNVSTFRTEKSKSAILTAARGLDIDNDAAQYIASLIPADRGQLRTLKEVYYGDKEKDFKPVTLFVNAMNTYPKLWKAAQKIEGLICGTGIHAGGVIFVDEPFTNSTALMRAPDGTVCTQFDLHDCENVSLIKYDALSVEAMDKIHICLDLLCKAHVIEQKPTLKETYEATIGIYNLERKETKMWEMVWNHKIMSLFQMEQESGVHGIALSKPKSVNDLSVLNSVIRLMAPDKNSDTPLEMWSKYRKNISLWINEMKRYGLKEEEIEWLSHHSAITNGICESQEGYKKELRLSLNPLNCGDSLRVLITKLI